MPIDNPFGALAVETLRQNPPAQPLDVYSLFQQQQGQQQYARFQQAQQQFQQLQQQRQQQAQDFELSHYLAEKKADYGFKAAQHIASAQTPEEAVAIASALLPVVKDYGVDLTPYIDVAKKGGFNRKGEQQEKYIRQLESMLSRAEMQSESRTESQTRTAEAALARQIQQQDYKSGGITQEQVREAAAIGQKALAETKDDIILGIDPDARARAESIQRAINDLASSDPNVRLSAYNILIALKQSQAPAPAPAPVPASSAKQIGRFKVTAH